MPMLSGAVLQRECPSHTHAELQRYSFMYTVIRICAGTSGKQTRFLTCIAYSKLAKLSSVVSIDSVD